MSAPEPKREYGIARALKAARRVLLFAGVISFFVNILMLTGPIYMLQIYDRVLASRSYETLTVITLLIFGLFAAMAILDFVRGALLSRAGDAFEKQLTDPTFELAATAARKGVANAAQPLKDLRQIRQFVASPALTAVFDAPWSPFFFALVFLMHWLLGVVALVGLIVLVVLAVVNERVSRKANFAAQAKSIESDRLAAALFRNTGAADSMGMRRNLKDRWRAASDEANESGVVATDRIGGLTAISKAARLFLQSAVLGTGALLAIEGEISPGVMIAASIITGRALAPIEIVTSQWRHFALTANAFQRLKAFIGFAGKPPERTALPPPVGAISVERLYCRPGSAKKPVLKNVSFTLAPGEALGIIGPSAAGKSTLARAIVGVESAVAGEVRIDGANIAHWDPEALGRHIGFMPQEAELFAGSAAENISRFDQNPDPAEIVAAAKAAGAHEMILLLPDGYDTDIGEGGRNLSAGQRQRLSLSRALYGEPALIVLDEPNANLDREGEVALVRAMQSLKARRATTIVIAHRRELLAFADKILLLADGEVQGFGARDEILGRHAPNLVKPTIVSSGA